MNAIVVTGIGGAVGQGILRNLRAMDLELRIIGTNVERVSAGNHLCDHVHRVPFAFEDGYVAAMEDLIARHDARLILPSTDYEAYHLSLNQSRLSARVAASPAPVAAMCLDKYRNFELFERHGLAFADSVLPSNYRGQFERVVVKPREGRGSREIHVDPPNPGGFSDEYVVQKYLDGPELTTAFYVLQSGELHGFITLQRELEQGCTSRCEVATRFDSELGEQLSRIIAVFPFRGSCNIQSRVTRDGVIPFEINCRISGTNSIRSQFGFRDVAYTVQELLLGQSPDPPAVCGGAAVRILLDVVYPGKTLSEITNRHDEFRIF